MRTSSESCERHFIGHCSILINTSAGASSTRYLPSCLVEMAMARRNYPRAHLRQRVEHWGNRLKVQPRIVRVQRMTRKWGSCSTKGIVTLAEDLANQGRGFQDFVIAHELLHLRIPNHGKVFKALMNLHVPGWRKHDVQRRRSMDADAHREVSVTYRIRSRSTANK